MKVVPMEEVVFEFPAQYQDTGPEGDKLWNDLMPCKPPANHFQNTGLSYLEVGSGFVRVPWPRRFDIPKSIAVPDDPEVKGGDRSRFAGNGHEYHCLDYCIPPSLSHPFLKKIEEC
jgi:hypothetical protein